MARWAERKKHIKQAQPPDILDIFKVPSSQTLHLRLYFFYTHLFQLSSSITPNIFHSELPPKLPTCPIRTSSVRRTNCAQAFLGIVHNANISLTDYSPGLARGSDGNTYSQDSINLSVSKALDLLKAGSQIGEGKFPHAFKSMQIRSPFPAHNMI